jgi:predicted ATPase
VADICRQRSIDRRIPPKDKMKITKLNIEGFRSLRNVSWHPGDLNVIIGPNGTGKSNLLRFLELIAVSAQGQLGKYVQSLGGMDPIVWDGKAASIKFVMEIVPANELDPEQYELELVRLGYGSSYKIENERLINSHKQRRGAERNPFKFLERHAKSAVIFDENERTFVTPEEYVSDEESLLSLATGPFTKNHFIPPFQRELASITVYRDLNTNENATIRQSAISRMGKRVDTDGKNLISVMHTLYTGDRDFKNDINAAMQAAFGDDFEELVFPPAADQRIQLRIRWKSLKREQSAAELSDGTLRFLFLLTALASPSLAPIIAIDEPETGLHPSMLPLIAEYAIDASKRSQIILTTHSPQFLDAFGDTRPTTTVAKWVNGETILQTLREEDLDYWLREYSLGNLFKSGELEQME